MKAVLALAVLCGAILSVESACSTTEAATCTSSLTATCDGYNTYLTCLKAAINSCTSSSVDLATKSATESTISTAESYINAQCGGCMVTMSLTTLILSLLAVYLKS